MALVCPGCGHEYDVTLFEFGHTVTCDCGFLVNPFGTDLPNHHSQNIINRVTPIGAPQRTKRNGTLVRVMSESDGADRRQDPFSPLSVTRSAYFSIAARCRLMKRTAFGSNFGLRSNV